MPAILPVMVLGFALFVGGFAVLFVLLGRAGGFVRSRWSVVAEAFGSIARGHRGVLERRLLHLSFASVGLGAVFVFAAVAQQDALRARACEERCREEGYSSARIGPNSDRTKDKKTWWVACICEDPQRDSLEFEANALKSRSD